MVSSFACYTLSNLPRLCSASALCSPNTCVQELTLQLPHALDACSSHSSVSADAASQRAAKPLQPFNFAALAKAVPGAAPLPAIPPSARTLDELEGRAAAGTALPPAASPGVPPGFAAKGPAAHRPSQQGPPPGAAPAAGGMPGANLLSLLNTGLRQPTAAPPAVQQQVPVGQATATHSDPAGGSLAALLQGGGGALQRPAPMHHQYQQPAAGDGGTGLLAMLQGVRQDAGPPPPPPAPQMQPQVAAKPLVNYGDRVRGARLGSPPTAVPAQPQCLLLEAFAPSTKLWMLLWPAPKQATHVAVSASGTLVPTLYTSCLP